MIGLTKQQLDCLNFIKAFLNEHGFAPSYQEINDAFGLHSKSSVYRLMRALCDRGYIRQLPNRARSLEVVDHAAAKAALSFLDAEVRNFVSDVAFDQRKSPEELVSVIVKDWKVRYSSFIAGRRTA